MHWQQSGIKNNLSELCKQARRAHRPPARATVTFMEKLIKSTLSLRNASSSLTRASRPSHRRVVTVRPTHHREALLLHLWPPCLWWYTWSSSLLTSTPSGTERDFRERRVDKVETHEIWYIQTDQCETVCSTLPGSYLKHHDCECPEDRLREKQRLFLLSYIKVWSPQSSRDPVFSSVLQTLPHSVFNKYLQLQGRRYQTQIRDARLQWEVVWLWAETADLCFSIQRFCFLEKSLKSLKVRLTFLLQ